jgi:hydroxypyruvate isomerase
MRHYETPNVVSLGPQQWFTRDDIAARLGVSTRTISRMYQRGEIEKRETAEGMLYRLVPRELRETDSETAEDKLSRRTEAGQERTALVAIALEEWTLARESLARLETRLESAQEDVRRAVEYARNLEEEYDRLAALVDDAENQAAAVRSEFDEERGRRQELAEQYRFVLGELEAMGGLRGKYHLERGRREEAEDRLEALGNENLAMRRHIERLEEALEEARRRGFRAEVGPLIVEIKR